MTTPNSEQLSAIRVVLNYLDAEMEAAPNRELADVSNFLEAIYQENK